MTTPTSSTLHALAVAALLSAMLVSPGCESFPLTKDKSDDGETLADPVGAGLVIAHRPYIADVPLPVGFVAVPSRSTSYIPPKGPRIVDHTYQGLASVADASRFYRQHLPGQGWQFVRERADGSITAMSYVKGEESLVIEISHPRVLDVIIRIRDRNNTALGGAMKP